MPLFSYEILYIVPTWSGQQLEAGFPPRTAGCDVIGV